MFYRILSYICQLDSGIDGIVLNNVLFLVHLNRGLFWTIEIIETRSL